MNKRQRKCGEDEFTVMTCNYCHNHTAKCNHCEFNQQYSGNKMHGNFRKKMGKHVSVCRNNSRLIDQEASEILANASPNHLPTDNIFDGDDNIFAQDESTNYDDNSFSVEAEVNEDLALSNQSFRSSQLTYDSLPLPNYEIQATNNYIQMEIEMYHNHNQCLGGYRSACWRSRYRLDLFGPTNMFSMDDAKFMLYVTSLTRQNTHSTNDTLFKLLGAIEKRYHLSYMNDTVVIPTDL